MERLPEQRGEGKEAVSARSDPAPMLSPLGVDVGQPAALDAASVLALQRSAGNAAVTGLMRRAQSPQREDPTAAGGSGPQPALRSPSQLLRSKLRSGRSAGRAMLHRAIVTSGGEWDTEEYDLKQDINGSGAAVPAAQGLRGLNIKLKFKPNDLVDAELIGMTQTAQTFVAAAPVFIGSAGTRSIPAADAKPIGTGAGETDESTHIDRASGYNNPIYPVSSAASGSLDDPTTSPGWGQHGWHYTDKAKKVQHQDAKLIDKPRAGGAQKDSRQIFETTAIATKGAQAGTYYGSVRWGWHTDGAAAFTKVALQKVSDGVPSSTFLKSAALWNPGKSSTGAENVDLPIPDVKVTTGPVTLAPPVPMRDIALPVGTRLQIVRDLVGPMLNGTVKVVDGPHTGVTGDVSAAEWPNIADERA